MSKKDYFRELALTLLVSAFCFASAAFFVASYCGSMNSGGGKISMFVLVLELVVTFLILALSIARLEKLKSDHLNKAAGLLAQSEQRFRLFAEFSDNVHFDADILNDRISFNSNFECVFGQKPGISKLSDWRNLLSFIALEDLQVLLDAWKKAAESGPHAAAELRVIDAEGRMLWHRLDLVAQFDSNGTVISVLGKLTNIDAQIHKALRMRPRATYDPLTRLYSREAAQALIDDFLTADGKGGRHALLIIGIDGLKEAANVFGRPSVDSLLAGFSKAMKKAFHSTDILARPEDDEFLIFLRDVPSDYMLEYKIGAFMRAVGGLRIDGKENIPVAFSAGSALYDRDGGNFSGLYKAAETALFDSRFSGNGSYSFFILKEQQTL